MCLNFFFKRTLDFIDSLYCGPFYHMTHVCMSMLAVLLASKSLGILMCYLSQFYILMLRCSTYVFDVAKFIMYMYITYT
jgi:hypothetical protein